MYPTKFSLSYTQKLTGELANLVRRTWELLKQKKIELKHKNRWANKSSKWSRVMRSVRQTDRNRLSTWRIKFS